MPPFPNEELKLAYQTGTSSQREVMTALRDLVFQTAKDIQGIGEIEESLKWGQPTFSTVRPKSGSPFRIAPVKDSQEKVGLYFICTTTLVSEFRERYGGELVFEGNRAIILENGAGLPMEAIGHCMAMALTYNTRKSR